MIRIASLALASLGMASRGAGFMTPKLAPKTTSVLNAEYQVVTKEDSPIPTQNLPTRSSLRT